MRAVIEILALWLLFAATHVGLSSQRLRPLLVARLGEPSFAALYSLVALAIFVPLVALYFDNQHAGPPLWYLGGSGLARALATAGMAVAVWLILGGLLRPAPTSMQAKRGAPPEARGVLRLTRHPLFMGFAVFGAVHLLAARLNAAELVFFAGFPLFTVVGCMHQDRRMLAARGEPYARFLGETALIPFARGGLLPALREAWLPLLLALLATLAIRWIHPRWMGGAFGG